MIAELSFRVEKSVMGFLRVIAVIIAERYTMELSRKAGYVFRKAV